MTRTFYLLVILTLSLARPSTLFSQLAAPEKIVRLREELGLSQQQLQRINAIAQTGQKDLSATQQQLQIARKNYAAQLRATKIDEATALVALERVSKAEANARRIQTSVMIRVRNLLTPEQVRMLADNKTLTQAGGETTGSEPGNKAGRTTREAGRAGLQQRLQAKHAAIANEVQRRTKNGSPPVEVLQEMRQFSQLMERGLPQEAESILDRVLKMLNLPEATITSNSPTPQPQRKLAKPPQPADDDLTAPANADKSLLAFFNPTQTQSVHLHINEADLKRMHDALPKQIYVPASFRWRDKLIANVGVRYKGNSSARPHQQHKRSFLIKFNKYDKAQHFFGLHRASLDNGVQFGSLFSEPIVTNILRAEGIPTHRCNYARLYLNNRYHGIYVNVERIDEVFLARHFTTPSGPLWKNDLGGPGGNLQFIGDNPKAYTKAFEAKNDLAKHEMGRLVDFIQFINEADSDGFAKQFESTFAIDDFLTVTAVMLYSGAFDQLTGWGPHNFYMYQDPDQQRWRYLPWDLDVGFAELAFGRVHILDDWNAAWPIPIGTQNPLLERIIANPGLLSKYRRMAKSILEKHFEPEQLCKVIDDHYAMIKTDLAADPFPDRRATSPNDRGYDGIVDSMKEFVRKRYVSATEQLNHPGKRPLKPTRRANHSAELQRRIQQVATAVEEMLLQGKDASAIAQIMQQVGPLLQAGKEQEAEEKIAEALRLTSEVSE